MEKHEQLYMVEWHYNGLKEVVPEMNGKPQMLCKWWARTHKRDSQYAKGQFVVSACSTKKA